MNIVNVVEQSGCTYISVDFINYFRAEMKRMISKTFPLVSNQRAESRGWRMVKARLSETARLAFFFASPRLFYLLKCETEIYSH